RPPCRDRPLLRRRAALPVLQFRVFGLLQQILAILRIDLNGRSSETDCMMAAGAEDVLRGIRLAIFAVLAAGVPLVLCAMALPRLAGNATQSSVQGIITDRI